jgi:hypothetical protein
MLGRPHKTSGPHHLSAQIEEEELPEGAYVLDLQANEGSVETDRVAPDADAEITAMTGRGKVLVQGR